MTQLKGVLISSFELEISKLELLIYCFQFSILNLVVSNLVLLIYVIFT